MGWGSVPSVPAKGWPKGSEQQREGARSRCSFGSASAQLYQLLHPGQATPALNLSSGHPRGAASRANLETQWWRGGGSNGKPPLPSCSILVRIQVPKVGRGTGSVGRGKGKEGRAGAVSVLQVPSLQCQAGPRSRLVTWLQSVSPRNQGRRAGCPSKGTFSEMPAWAKRYDPQPGFGDTTL